VAWEELDGLTGANIYTIRDAGTLIQRAESDLLKGWGQAKQALPDL
jgi:bifunctional non-homologous end joining protein LigD